MQISYTHSSHSSAGVTVASRGIKSLARGFRSVPPGSTAAAEFICVT